MIRLVALLGSVTDKHAPIRKVTGKKKKLLSKPNWITTTILTSIKPWQKEINWSFDKESKE